MITLKKTSRSRVWLVYLLVVVILFVLQLLINRQSYYQIRFEEMLENAKATYWYSQHLLISGLHTNIGWYSLMSLIYSIFGFNLHSAANFRLVLSLISLLSLAYLIQRYFSFWPGIILLLVLGLSPSLLYFNSMNLHLGLDMQIVPIYLLILNLLDFQRLKLSIALTAILFLLLANTAITYPTFTFYVLPVSLFWLYRLWQSELLPSKRYFYLTVAGICALLPLLLNFWFIDNRQILIYDSVNNSGLFRGGGKISLSEDVFSAGLGGLIRDLTIRADSYHFEVNQVDFSQVYPIISLLVTSYLIFLIYRQILSSRLLINLGLLTLITNLIIISITSDYGIAGMKRSTPSLISLYFFLSLAWYFLTSGQVSVKWNKLSWLLIAPILIHHLIVYPVNYIHAPDQSPFFLGDWFSTGYDPQTTLDGYLLKLQTQDLKLDCRPLWSKGGNCNYDMIYAPLQASCQWNHLSCRNIYGYSRLDANFIPLNMQNMADGGVF